MRRPPGPVNCHVRRQVMTGALFITGQPFEASLREWAVATALVALLALCQCTPVRADTECYCPQQYLCLPQPIVVFDTSACPTGTSPRLAVSSAFFQCSGASSRCAKCERANPNDLLQLATASAGINDMVNNISGTSQGPGTSNSNSTNKDGSANNPNTNGSLVPVPYDGARCSASVSGVLQIVGLAVCSMLVASLLGSFLYCGARAIRARIVRNRDSRAATTSARNLHHTPFEPTAFIVVGDGPDPAQQLVLFRPQHPAGKGSTSAASDDTSGRTSISRKLKRPPQSPLPTSARRNLSVFPAEESRRGNIATRSRLNGWPLSTWWPPNVRIRNVETRTCANDHGQNEYDPSHEANSDAATVISEDTSPITSIPIELPNPSDASCAEQSLQHPTATVALPNPPPPAYFRESHARNDHEADTEDAENIR